MRTHPTKLPQLPQLYPRLGFLLFPHAAAVPWPPLPPRLRHLHSDPPSFLPPSTSFRSSCGDGRSVRPQHASLPAPSPCPGQSGYEAGRGGGGFGAPRSLRSPPWQIDGRRRRTRDGGAGAGAAGGAELARRRWRRASLQLLPRRRARPPPPPLPRIRDPASSSPSVRSGFGLLPGGEVLPPAAGCCSAPPRRIVGLLYTSNGNMLLALGSDAVYNLWKRQSSCTNANNKLWQSANEILMKNDTSDGNPEEARWWRSSPPSRRSGRRPRPRISCTALW